MIDLTKDQIGYLHWVHLRALYSTEKAMNKFPQPNYVLTKIAEEGKSVV